MSKNARRTKVYDCDEAIREPVLKTTVVKEVEDEFSDKTAAELREEARKLLVRADMLDDAEIKAAERAKAKKQQAEAKGSHQRVFFTHNADGSIDFDHPFMSAWKAKHYDSKYVVVPSLVDEDGRYIRPLTKEEAYDG